jgi:hypothetical protein
VIVVVNLAHLIIRQTVSAYEMERWHHVSYNLNPSSLFSSISVERLIQAERKLAKLETLCLNIYRLCQVPCYLLWALYLLQIKEFEGKETAQLVDRYKFLDLYPCTPAELR